MSKVEIEYNQSGMVPGKSQKSARWTVDTNENTIFVEKETRGQSWKPVGEMQVESASVESMSFDSDVWEIISYQSPERNGLYTLLVEGPVEKQNGYYYHMKLRYEQSGRLRTIEEAFLTDMPTVKTED